LLVWLADTGAYFAGRAFGRRKLAPAVSPGKTWEGLVGGVVFSSLASLLLLAPLADLAPGYALLVGAILGVVGQVGDLAESLLKRDAGVKDSGSILPGFGGVLDLIGAARPSIADPFLPNKIAQGRIDEIRECIGCNICVSGDNLSVPIRCTQNPTMGEEWRRKWHPEKIAPKASDSSVLVVGAGPSGLEAALQLANRGYQVTLAESGKELGGRATKESQLPGLSSYARVRDYRVNLLTQMANVEIYKDSPLDEDAILEFGFPHVLLATGSHWRRDGTGRYYQKAIPGLSTIPGFTPDDIMNGKNPTGHTIIYDDDHYYMGGVLAEKLISDGEKVTLVTPAAKISAWSEYTLEQEKIQAKLINLGVELITNQAVSNVAENQIGLSCTFTGRTKTIQGDSLLLVTAKHANDALYHQLQSNPDKLEQAGIKTLEVIGDAYSPGSLASAVYYGHLAARCLEGESWDAALFDGERPGLIS
ncbi:phosphatidate cytidylyltransferase, partial [uncultured Kiloniella sp.]|uniref:phosphatidate cytidylyltransferase n=1 Tax=uncultured Kiloniella sp. TaxID=1133091 RepID=UPI00262F935E